MNTVILPKASPLQLILAISGITILSVQWRESLLPPKHRTGLAPVRSSQGGKTPIRVSYATLSLYAVDEDYFHNPQVIQIFFFLPNCIIFIPIPRDQNPFCASSVLFHSKRFILLTVNSCPVVCVDTV